MSVIKILISRNDHGVMIAAHAQLSNIDKLYHVFIPFRANLISALASAIQIASMIHVREYALSSGKFAREWRRVVAILNNTAELR